ncbi:MAG: twin-arginine translocation signal domain-containing protein [Actinobacteria bacterium]|nr:MAG: twin-arginine translocation signal domain-containing protein [Actinomycetota bacterium]
MGHKETDFEGRGLSRRDFLKATAATVAAGGVADFAFNAEQALAYEGVAGYTVTISTCPYCSAQCGQRVVVEDATGEVVDIYGDYQSPTNSGGLCAKGAGAFQLVTNPRRVGAYEFPMTYQNQTLAAHPEHAEFASDGTGDPVIYKRVEGVSDWTAIDMATGLSEIATAMVAARGSFTAGEASGYNSQSVAFFGCSHMNTDENYLYRRMIAQFGTTNTEHQARI